MKKIFIILSVFIFTTSSAISDGHDIKKDGHEMDQATCFQYYNPVILEYIASRI